MPFIPTQCDVVVLGAGSGGLTSAVGFAKVGKRVLLIEREHMGGECTNSGCIPSKALLHRAKSYYAAQRIAGVFGEADAYRTGALDYVRATINGVLAEETPEHFASMGITVVMGEAVFENPCTVRVGDVRYSFRTAVIATGSRPQLIQVSGLDESLVLTNQNIFSITTIPERLLVIGGGPIGVELGEAFAMLGSKVTMAVREDRILSLEDDKVSTLLTEKFKEIGIRIITTAELVSVHGTTATVRVGRGDGDTTEKVSFDRVLMAVGRIPNLPTGLKDAGIAYDERGILIDSQYRTSNKDVYALGDVADALKFTHVADDAARQVVMRVVSRSFLRVNRTRAVPRVTYTEPEVASVGVTHAHACAKYDCEELLRVEVPYALNDRARTDDVREGYVIVTVRRFTGRILGANVVGAHAGDLIALFTLAIDHKLSLWALRRTIYAYPTYALLVKRAGDLFLAQTVADFKKDSAYLVKKHAPKLFASLFWLIVLVSFHQYRTGANLSYRDMLVMLHTVVTTTTWGPLLYMTVYALRPLLLFPATLLTALSGLLFGLPLGMLYTVIGENASANFAYWIGRFFGKDLKLEDSILGKWVEALRSRPFMSVLFMRLFYVPFDLTNFGSGFLRVPWRAYAGATLVGIMPGLITFVALGASVKDITSFELSRHAFDFVSLAIAVTVFVISLTLSHMLKRWHATREDM